MLCSVCTDSPLVLLALSALSLPLGGGALHSETGRSQRACMIVLAEISTRGVGVYCHAA
jgi:hypothetical protein